jgi:hypothetical protein
VSLYLVDQSIQPAHLPHEQLYLLFSSASSFEAEIENIIKAKN